ncbi:MAG: GNAT family N-acetyltransferase [Candidatus Dormibacteria bacterium]
MSEIRIRDALCDDAPFLVECNAAMARETENKTLDLAVLALGTRAVFEQPSRGFYLVAERASERVGCLLVTTEWSDWRNGDWWWIQSVYVVAGARRSGVFRALYAETERRARAKPGVVGLRLYVEWENRHAQRTYAALGMTQAHYHLYQRSFIDLDRASAESSA